LATVAAGVRLRKIDGPAEVGEALAGNDTATADANDDSTKVGDEAAVSDQPPPLNSESSLEVTQ
jgi:hypothetical protein